MPTLPCRKEAAEADKVAEFPADPCSGDALERLEGLPGKHLLRYPGKNARTCKPRSRYSFGVAWIEHW